MHSSVSLLHAGKYRRCSRRSKHSYLVFASLEVERSSPQMIEPLALLCELGGREYHCDSALYVSQARVGPAKAAEMLLAVGQ